MSTATNPAPGGAAQTPNTAPSTAPRTASQTATEHNRAVYDAIWPQMSDYIRFNPGARHRRRQVLRFLDGLRFESLLDVGCGNAELLRILDARYPGRRMMGIDLSQTVVDQNTRTFPHMGFAVANVEVEELPWPTPDRPADVVVCCEVLEHLDRPQDALARIARALPRGGHCVITTPTGKVHETEKRFGHVRHPRPRELALQAQSAGFDVVELLTWGWPVYAFTKWATNLNPDAALDRFAGEKPYGLVEKGVSLSLWAANFLNLDRFPLGVQLFALLQKR